MRISLPLTRPPAGCTFCGCPASGPHDDECVFAEHAAMEAGDPLATAVHDPEECELCLMHRAVVCACRCGRCCRSLLIEVSELDALREPLIQTFASPVYLDARLTTSGQRELVGYLLNGPGAACIFLDERNSCTIHDSRPLVCRLYDCDHSELCSSGPEPPSVV